MTTGQQTQDIKWAREPPLSPRLLDLIPKNARLSARSLCRHCCCPKCDVAMGSITKRVPQCSFALGKYCTALMGLQTGPMPCQASTCQHVGGDLKNILTCGNELK